MKQPRQPLRTKINTSNKKKRLETNDTFDPVIAAEDRELQRLERLLGIKKKGKVSNDVKDKLNREFEDEGFGSDFGSFLFELDELADGMNASKPDDEMDREDEESIDTKNDENNSIDGDNHFQDVKEIGSADETALENDSFTYSASAGEDIYGRTTSGNQNEKYIPPSRRKIENLEQSELDILVGRKINGLLNKLSDTSKDFVIRGIKEIYDTNSHTITNQSIFRTFKGLITSTNLRQAVIIELFSLVIGGLHFSIGTDVSSFMVEQAFQEFQTNLLEIFRNKDVNSIISYKKQAINYITFLAFLYAFRVIHHKLIVDMILSLVTNNMKGFFDENLVVEGMIDPDEFRLELIEIMLNVCGDIIRSDDFESFSNIHAELAKSLRNRVDFQSTQESLTRVEFLLEVLSNLKSSSKQKSSSPITTRIKSYRQWIGQIKQTIGNKVGDSILHFSLIDLVTMKTKGRWWKLGATWKQDETPRTQQTVIPEAKDLRNESLDKLAMKMKLNTGVRKSILSALFTSRDVLDAFERLQRLELKGKLEREIIRVMIECCAREKAFNPFYAELLKLLCSRNRQMKTTFQYALWDFIKSQRSHELDSEKEQRMLINVARMLSMLVLSFHVPLAILKIFEISDLEQGSILFLSTFFVAIFKGSISNTDFQNLCDRVGTSKDALSLRDTILYFNQTYMKNVEKSFDSATSSMIKSRKRILMSTMKEMDVLKINVNDKLIADDLD